MISGVFLVLLLLVILVWPWVSPYHPDTLSNAQFQPPDTRHWCGTDVHGRDLLSRIFFGARVSLLVGAVGAGVSLIIGVLWGAVAGYAGGRLDGLMMRFVDVLYSLPSVIFVIVLITTLETLMKDWMGKAMLLCAVHDGNSAIEILIKDWVGKVLGHLAAGNVRLLFLFIGLGAVSWLTMARIVRGQVLSLRSRNFVEASRTLGASHTRILFRHILPNMYGVIIVYLTLTVPSVILYESFLSFLGLGIQPPQASWGSLLAEGAGQINPIQIYWWLLLFPGATLVVTLLALNFLGDGLREALDPRAER